jgi:GntR family transcriptional regulator
MTRASALDSALLDDSLPTPLYHQIYLILRERILNGDFPTGSLLPGEQELTRLLNVSRITVKRALNELAEDRLVSRHRGRGTIVTGRRMARVVRGSFDTLLESLKQMGLETEVQLLDVSDLPAAPHVAEQLRIKPGDPVQRITRMRKIEGEPFSHIVSFLPAGISAGFSREDLARRTMLELLEEAGAGAHEAEQWITATAAEPHVAASLLLAVGAPLLKIERIVRDRRGRPVQLVNALYRPDRFEYHIRAQRQKGDTGWKQGVDGAPR